MWWVTHTYQWSDDTHTSTPMWWVTISIWFDEWHVYQHWCDELPTLNTDEQHTLISINVTQTKHKCGNTFISTDNTVSENGYLLVVKLLIIREDCCKVPSHHKIFKLYKRCSRYHCCYCWDYIYRYKTLWVKGKEYIDSSHMEWMTWLLTFSFWLIFVQ
jgi:hypothetical protein